MRCLFWFILLIPILIANLLGSETFWVAVGSLVTAATLIYFISKDYREQQKSVENIKKTIYFELIADIEGLFSGEVERKPIFEVMNTVRKDFAKYIIDQDTFAKFQALYSELDYYETYIEMTVLSGKWDARQYSVIAKQISTQNKFLKFFGETEVTLNPASAPGGDHVAYANSMRNGAIKIKEQKIADWKIELERQINQIFG
jgi:hypothetical protein